MKTISALVIVIGLGLSPAGCVFHPDMGEWEKCDLDSDCDGLGDCACVEGKCVPAYDGAGCASASECETPEIPCGDTCVDVTDDPDHCGRCDHPCDSPPPATCDEDGQGNVVAVTYAPVGTCDAGDCRYTPTSQDCPFGCEAGECLEGCQPGDCDPGEVCTEGFCRCGGDGPDCPSDQLCCGSECADPLIDTAHCGYCGVDCNDPPLPHCLDDWTLKVKDPGPCVLGTCDFSERFVTCQDGCLDDRCLDDPCGGPCVDPPPPWCEGEDLVEPVEVGTCVAGSCDYPEGGRTHCDFGCDGDAGGCAQPQCANDNDCAPGETCFNGECLCGSNPPCSADEACCGSGCVSLDDPNHCGGCDKPCYLGLPNVYHADCTDATCNFICNVGTDDCNVDLSDGCEVDLLVDPSNCGFCGTQCGLDACLEGDCLPTADDLNIRCGQVLYCGPGTHCCVDAESEWCANNDDSANCGSGYVLLCDNATDCPEGAVCCFDGDTQGTACVNEGGCTAGWVTCDIGETCADGSFCEEHYISNAATIGLCRP